MLNEFIFTLIVLSLFVILSDFIISPAIFGLPIFSKEIIEKTIKSVPEMVFNGFNENIIRPPF